MPKQKAYVACVRCKQTIGASKIRHHIESKHGWLLYSKTLDQLISQCVPGDAPEHPSLKSNAGEAAVEPVAGRRSKLLLVSRRGSRDGSGSCGECGRRVPTLWRYAESNKGTVRICERCKASAFDRSFGSIDAMSMSCQGGSCDGSRRH